MWLWGDCKTADGLENVKGSGNGENVGPVGGDFTNEPGAV